MKITKVFSAVLIFLTLLFACTRESMRSADSYKSVVKGSNSFLTAVIEVNTPGFFLQNGLPTGYHFELLRQYAQSRGLKLRVIPFQSLESAVEMVKSGEADILAIEGGSIADKELQKTVPHWRGRFSTISTLQTPPNRQSRVFIPKNLLSKGEFALIQKQFPHITLVDPLNMGLVVEMLFKANGGYAVVQSAIAEGIQLKHPNLRIFGVSDAAANSWFVSKQCRFLFDLNTWIASRRNTKAHSLFYSKYYQNSKVNSYLSNGVSLQGEVVLSQYDELIKKYSAKIGWDWLLVSALIYQESNFNAGVESVKGARGLMQVMPGTASLFGFGSSHSIGANVFIGTKLLSRLSSAFSKYPIPIGERNKFVLAAYNGGIGHILDAMKLTAKYGKNPYSWDDVALFLKLKRDPKYYNDKVTRFGVFNDNETTRFVVEILERYQYYKALTLS